MGVTTEQTQGREGLAEATRRLASIHAEIAAEDMRHERERERLERDLSHASTRRDLVLAGTPLTIIETAEAILEIRGAENAGVGDGPKEIARAINDIASGARHLQSSYIGTKDYDRWHGQSEGGSYGMSPSHGHTIFYIGLRPPYRATREPGRPSPRHVPAEPLTDEQADACIAYLHGVLAAAKR